VNHDKNSAGRERWHVRAGKCSGRGRAAIARDGTAATVRADLKGVTELPAMPFYRSDAQLATSLTAVLNAICSEFATVDRAHVAVTWLAYDPPYALDRGGAIAAADFWDYPVRGASVRGDVALYPASLVKLFYLVALHEWLERGTIALTPELERARRDAIVLSSNDATSLLVDVLTGTTSGPELSGEAFATWKSQRNSVDRYFRSLGWPELAAINVNQKTWCDGPYGRERQFVGAELENRNRLCTDAIARLLHAIVGGVAVSAARSLAMMELLRRDLSDPDRYDNDGENHIHGFLAESLPEDARVWSKAGWTSRVRHDAAYIEVPDCLPYLLVVCTDGFGAGVPPNRELLPAISARILEAMRSLPR